MSTTTQATSLRSWKNTAKFAAAAAVLSCAAGSLFAQTPAPATIGGPLHRVGPIDPVHGFPQWYQDTTGLAFEFGSVQTDFELTNGLVLLLPTDVDIRSGIPNGPVTGEVYKYPVARPLPTFFDEHFYWHAAALDIAAATPAGPTRVLVEFGLEGAFSTGATEVPGSQIVFTRIRLNMLAAPYSGTYTLETPYKTYELPDVVAGQRIFYTDDFGVAQAPEGFSESLYGPIGPFLVPAIGAPGGPEKGPYVSPEGRQYVSDGVTEEFVTGSPLGKNFVRLSVPYVDANGQPQTWVWQRNTFTMTGRIKHGRIPSNVSLVRASKFDAPGDQRVDIFATGRPTLPTRLPGTPKAAFVPSAITVYPAPPVTGAGGLLSIPTGIPGFALGCNTNVPSGICYYGQWISTTGILPTAVTGVDDNGFVTSVPVTDTVVVTKADFSNVTKLLTVDAVTANLNTPATFFLQGVDGVTSATTFTNSIAVPVMAPPSTVTVRSTAGGAATVPVTVGVPVNAFNHPPIAKDDTSATLGTNPVVISVLANDTDPDNNRLTIDSVTQSAGGTVTITDLSTTVTFTPRAGAFGPQTFTYTATDRLGGFSTATVTVNVDGLPTATPDAFVATAGIATPLDVLANDSDPDNDPLTITAFTQPVVNLVQLGTVSLGANGKSLSYVANPGSTGIHAFTYTISDGKGGVATANVAVTINTAPVAAADTFFDVDSQTGITLDVLANDTDIDRDTLTITAVSANPRVVLVNNGSSITFSPIAGQTLATETFTYTVSDGRGGVATANVSVIQNRSPVAVADSLFATTGITNTLTVLANDTDPDAGDQTNLIITSVSTPSVAGTAAAISADKKTLTFNWGAAVVTTGTSATVSYTISDQRGGTATATATITANRPPTAVNDTAITVQAGQRTLMNSTVAGQINVLANDSFPLDLDGDAVTLTSATANTAGVVVEVVNGSLFFTSAPNSTLSPQTFSYTISDAKGASASATVTVTVNSPPVAVADSANVSVNSAVQISVLGNDSDPNGNASLTVTALTQGLLGVASIDTPARTVTYRANGTTGTDTFTYTVSDGAGGSATGTVTVTIAAAPNRPSVAVNQPISGTIIARAPTPAGTGALPASINLLNGASDPDGDVVRVATVGTVAAGNGTVTLGNAATGAATYTPTFAASAGTGIQTFTFTVTDGKAGGTSAAAVVSVQVNDNPAITQSDYVVSKSAWTIAGTAGPGATVTVTTKSSNGTVTTIGTVTADTRGAWRLAPVLTIDATATILDLTSTQRGATNRAIVRK
jgi:hypothetical protein